MENFKTSQLTLSVVTQSGKELTFTTTNQDLVKYYGAFRKDSVRPTVINLYQDAEGEFQLSYPNYSQAKKLRVSLVADPVIVEVSDELGDDSWI